MLSKCHPLLSFPFTLLKQDLYSVLYIKSLSFCEPTILPVTRIPYLEGLIAAAESAWVGLLLGQTLTGRLRTSGEMRGGPAMPQFRSMAFA